MMVFECRKADGGRSCMNENSGICLYGAPCEHMVKTDDMRLYREMCVRHQSQNL